MLILNIDDMMFLNINEKKEKANAISYKIDEYISGDERILLPIAPMVRKADTPMQLIKLVIWGVILANGR